MPIPQWAAQLPEYMRPTSNQIKKLETIRQQIEAPQEAFYLFIAGHPASTRKVQHYHYSEFKSQYPEWSHCQILEAILRSRWSAGVAQGLDLFGLGNYPPDEIERKIKEIARQAGTVDGLAELFIKTEGTNQIAPSPGYEADRAEIDHILGEFKTKSAESTLTPERGHQGTQHSAKKTLRQSRATGTQEKKRRKPKNK